MTGIRFGKFGAGEKRSPLKAIEREYDDGCNEMNIALIGHGRMGQEIERLSPQLGHSVCVSFELGNSLQIDSPLHGAQVLIDFSTADSVWQNLEIAGQRRIPIVEGTTGWNFDRNKLQSIQGLTAIYSPNFSLGMHAFLQAVSIAADHLGRLKTYDSFVREIHHTGKADSPSGTAKKLARILLQKMPAKQSLLFDPCDRPIRPEQLHVTSTRAGRFAGIHEIGFDSAYDFIELKHTAHGRSGFAYGALRAAEWIVGRTGIYDMEDFVTSLHQE